MSKPLLLVLGDQLTLTLPTLCDAPSNAVVALCEVAEEARYVPHHLHKTGRIIRGRWFIGMDASRALYAVLGYRRVVRLSCLPGLRSMMDAGYRFFARRRIRLGLWWEKR
ncbi:hypothetical protein HAALTHF_27330n [Vreelandella aquamarina]|nr:hypothetical protein HAALTHF_27330n [Halomonas axialensis]